MVGKLELRRYKYTDVVLPKSKVTVNGRVNVVDGSIYSTEGNVQCSWMMNEEIMKRFSFSLNQLNNRAENEIPETWDAPLKAISNWPAELPMDDIIEEFKNFVLSDIA